MTLDQSASLPEAIPRREPADQCVCVCVRVCVRASPVAVDIEEREFFEDAARRIWLHTVM